MKLHLPKTLLNKLKFKKNLEAQLLNLYEAFELASVLSKYIDIEKSNPPDALDFIGNIIDKLSPEEYLECAVLLTRENKETIKTFASIEILTAFIEGLKLNQIVSLIWFYKSLGL